ncbi:MAG TPA: hypothetical protein VKR52_14825 [Terracidiphilus sp.]|nr:hypothetical protein [Terracidiphilus sp.]
MVDSSHLATQSTPGGILLRFDDSAPLQWSHVGDELLVEFSRDVPTSQPNVYSSNPVEYQIELTNGDHLSELGDGSGANVSPIGDRIAWYWNNKIVVANADGRNRQVLTAAPRWMLFFQKDFKGPLVWSPDGKQLFFGAFESETCRDSVYLLQVNTGRSRRFLRRTCLTIQDWR